MKNNIHGFTIIEILISIVILGVLTAVITSTMTGSLALNRDAQKQIDASISAQQAIEAVRDNWQASDINYQTACYRGERAAQIQLSYVNLDNRGNVITGPANQGPISDDCTIVRGINGASEAKDVPVMRKIVATYGSEQYSDQATKAPIKLELNVLRNDAAQVTGGK